MNNMKVRVCLTDVCNFKCKYCRPGGEGEKGEKNLSDEELVKAITILVEEGFEAVRLTGGEPTLRKGYINLAKKIRKNEGIKKLTMVTNGSTLDHNSIVKLKQVGFKSITISLDTVDKNKFAQVVGIDCFDKVLSTIIDMKQSGINVKINCVASKYNYDGLSKLIDFCNKNKIPLKILDLVCMDSVYWNKEWISLTKIKQYLESIATQIDVQYQDEGFGTPEYVYSLTGTTVTLKDSTLGTCYFKGCKECDKYPCQSGIVSMILTNDGKLKLCSLSNDYEVDLRPIISGENVSRADLRKLIKLYNEAQFQNLWWQNIGSETK